MNNIIVILPVLPMYRIDFFNKLSSSLLEDNKKLIVVTGENISNKYIFEASKLVFSVERCVSYGFTVVGYNLYWQKGLLKNIRKFKPERIIILYNAGNINFNLVLLYALFHKIPFTLWGCGHKRENLVGIKLKIKEFFKKFFIKKSHTYITYGSDYANKLIQLGYPPERIFIAQNTINVEKIIAAAKPEKRFNYSNTIRFLFVGALIPQKRLDKALQAFIILKNNNCKFFFTIVGEGNIKSDLQNSVDKLGLQKFVFIEGAKYGEELKKYFENSHVFILPGVGGLAVNEAMAYSLPLISTPADGTVYDLIEDGVNGFLLDYNYTLDEMISKLYYFIENDRDVIKKMGDKSLEIIKNKALLKNMVNQFKICIDY